MPEAFVARIRRVCERAGLPVRAPALGADRWLALMGLDKKTEAGDRVIALTGTGGFAEECLAEAHRVLPLPAGMDFDSGAALVLTYCTSLHALKDCGHLQPGETLVVLGAAGGVGISAIEIGKAMGARVIAAASTADKQDINRALLVSGASIGEMNCVRRHLSAIKGGRLAAACHPARVLNLLLSDVAGDDPIDIASGPTVPGPRSCPAALDILQSPPSIDQPFD